jgi:glycosyltransferase involved in cell wall biosynthesis/SAM-dependent methyltransferase
MNATGQTICLTMIVKNEASVIQRCMTSVRPLIDTWIIIDTGSSDGTQGIIREVMADLPGELFERPWVDFAHNRSEALTLARNKADYSFIIDADDTIEISPGFMLPDLTADSYSIEIQDAGVKYRRAQLVRNTLPWRYDGVLHEFLACESAQSEAMLDGVTMRRNHDGARRRDPKTYQKDAQILEQALAGDTSDFLRARYTFYLAQSYWDCGEMEKALQRYLERSELGFWDQERFISLYRAAQIKARLGHPDREILDTYQRATAVCPFRAEALHGASRYCRDRGFNEEGFQIAKQGLALDEPQDGLFVEPWIYRFGLLDELAVNGYASGHYRESLDASLQLLSDKRCVANERDRFVANARAAAQALSGNPDLGSAGSRNLVEKHALEAPRQLRSSMIGSPTILLAILAKQKADALPLYLNCIEALDYPKSLIKLYIRTNNNTDATEQILREWVGRVGHLYAGVEFDAENVETNVEQFAVHEWNATRFRVLGHIRNVSLNRALDEKCDFYFVADLDNFVRPETLRELVALNLPIVAPLLRSIAPNDFYSNYHAEIDANGYYKDSDQYQWILNQWLRGIHEVPVVHCTYLVRADVVRKLSYLDGSDRHEYVVFSASARKANVPQYLDNRQVYGYITFDESDVGRHVEGGIERARALLGPSLSPNRSIPRKHDLSVEVEDRVRHEFSRIYESNEWGYGSGVGSLPENNASYAKYISQFIDVNSVKSVVDFGCGDWQFSRLIDWRGATYTGVDLVEKVIARNIEAFANSDIRFQVFKSLEQLPSADLLLCKDVFQHLPNHLVLEYMSAFKKKFRRLLITNDDEPEGLVNSDIQAGGWRPIRLDAHPFNEEAVVDFSWMVTGGGWKPTHKSTLLIVGDSHEKEKSKYELLATS